MTIRAAGRADLPRILAIYNDAVLRTTATYDDQPHTLEMREAWFAAKQQSGMPVLVVADAQGVQGFGTYGPFRSFSGFRFTVEHSIYVAEERRGQGMGKLLLPALIDAAAGQGMHTMIAGIDATNAVSLRLHEAHGFTQAACLREVGYKFARWLDLIFLQKILAGEKKS
jgi:L-amino acid N-acyltransferase